MKATTDTLMHTINPSRCTLELDEPIDLASLWLLHLEGPTLFEPYELRSSRQPILFTLPLPPRAWLATKPRHYKQGLILA